VPDPVIVPRADHRISRRDIDPDALRVLHRLHQHHHAAFLVGGSVRDLLLERRPKDFDIGTDAHPYQIKRLFRNCWIIGRRFRLAHIKFGTKTIEVATFRRNVPDLPPEVLDATTTDRETLVVITSSEAEPASAPSTSPANDADAAMIHRDNTFGTPEEDAFRRDFTINGLFYDIATRSIIDYVGGLQDLDARVLRSIGDPRVRFVEDPVRMLRAAVFGSRLGFDLDASVVEAIAIHRSLILKASPARLLEEYYKVLRSGCAEASIRALGRVRLLELITPELRSPPDAVWDSLSRLDAYRQRFPAAPPELTNAVLMGSLLMPLGVLDRPLAPPRAGDPRAERVSIGMLPVARRDLERLRQMSHILPRLIDPDLPPRIARSLAHRPSFDDALVWLEVFGDAPDAVERWKHAQQQQRAHAAAHRQAAAAHPPAARPPSAHPAGAHAVPQDGDQPPKRRRRRRRRRRGRGGGTAA
jgi:poly(A) polymerase